MGCQDLLDDVPGRSRKGDQQQQAGMFSSPSDLKSFMKGVTRSSSKSYNIKDETSTKSKERKSTIVFIFRYRNPLPQLTRRNPNFQTRSWLC